MLRILRSSLFAQVNRLGFRFVPTASFENFKGSVRFFSRFTAEEEKSHRAIEAWVSTFRKDMIPFASFEKSFARSSGPGGQNVNKVNSKAEIRFALYSASWILPEVREKMKIIGSRYYNSAGEMVITSEVHRTQAQNLVDCQDKLYDLIKESSKYVISLWKVAPYRLVPKQTSEEQKEKVEKLKSAHNKRRLEDKKILKEKKQSRTIKSSKYD